MLPLAGEKKKGLNISTIIVAGPFQGLKLCSCLKLGNELSKETHVLTKQENFIGKGQLDGEQQGKGTRENSSGFSDGVSFRVVSGQSFGLRVLPGGACTP